MSTATSVLASATPLLVPWPVVVVPLLLLAYWAYCLYDFSRTDEADMRTYSRGVWLLLLVFTNVVGGTLWLVYGRPPRPHNRISTR